MTTEFTSRSPLSRRRVAQGVAWTAPAVAVSSAAPAIAASGSAGSTVSGKQFTLGYGTKAPNTNNLCSPSGKVGFEWMMKTTYGDKLCLSNITSLADIKSLSITFYVASNSLTWTPVSGTSQCWSAPVLSGATETYNGVTFYGYVSNFTCPSTANNWTLSGTTACVNVSTAGFDFTSSCLTSQLTSSQRFFTYVVKANVYGTGDVVVPASGWGPI